jgi:class 3 adenylate cyclase
MDAPQIQYATTSDGVSIAYATMGEGRPIVLSTRVWGDIHVYSAVEQFRPYIGALVERGWRVIFYDGRGMGSSRRDATDLGLTGRSLDLEAVIEAVGSDRLDLCGGQSGGPAAIVYAARHPERVSHLVLVNTSACGIDYYESTPSLRVARDLIHIAEDQWEFYTLALANALWAFSDVETARRIATTIRAGVSPKAWIADREGLEQIDVMDMLSSIAVSTLVIHDRSDTIGDFSMLTSKLASQIPSARFVATDDAVGAMDKFLREGDATPEPHLPSGMKAILFADIADSTALTERIGDDAFREKARGLDAAMRSAIRENSGSPIEGKTLGDGVLAVFTSAKQAIACAQACHEAASADGLALHAGIHAGDVIREADPDGRGNVYGGAVNIAARVAAASGAGETLVSATVRDLARTSAGVTFEDRGEQALKGVADPVRLFAVRQA